MRTAEEWSQYNTEGVAMYAEALGLDHASVYAGLCYRLRPSRAKPSAMPRGIVHAATQGALPVAVGPGHPGATRVQRVAGNRDRYVAGTVYLGEGKTFQVASTGSYYRLHSTAELSTPKLKYQGIVRGRLPTLM